MNKKIFKTIIFTAILTLVVGITGCGKIKDTSKATSDTKSNTTVKDTKDIKKDEAFYRDKLYFKSMDNLWIGVNGKKYVLRDKYPNIKSALKDIDKSNYDDYTVSKFANINTMMIDDISYLQLDFANTVFFHTDDKNTNVKMDKTELVSINLSTNPKYTIELPNGVKFGDSKETVIEKWGYPGSYAKALKFEVQDWKNINEFDYVLESKEGNYDIKAFFREGKLHDITFKINTNVNWIEKK